MQQSAADQYRRTGRAALAAGTLLLAGVAAELAVPVQTPDGALTRPVLWSVYVLTWLLGSAALVRALAGLRSLSPPQDGRRRSGRTGYRLARAGALLLVAFGAVHLVSGLVTGTPAEAAFLLFGVGLLLCVPGQLLVGLHLRRSRVVSGWWATLPLAAAGLVAGVTVPADPWHDLGLFAFDIAWMALGVGLLKVARTAPSEQQAVSTTHPVSSPQGEA